MKYTYDVCPFNRYIKPIIMSLCKTVKIHDYKDYTPNSHVSDIVLFNTHIFGDVV